MLIRCLDVERHGAKLDVFLLNRSRHVIAKVKYLFDLVGVTIQKIKVVVKKLSFIATSSMTFHHYTEFSTF